MDDFDRYPDGSDSVEAAAIIIMVMIFVVGLSCGLLAALLLW